MLLLNLSLLIDVTFSTPTGFVINYLRPRPPNLPAFVDLPGF